MTTRELIFADLHQAEGAWAHRPIKGDAYFAFEQIVNYALEPSNGIAELIGLGDLLDVNRPGSEPMEKLSEQMYRLEQKQKCVRYVQGQHEMADPPWLSLFRNTVHMHGKMLSYDKAYGLDFRPTGVLQQELAAIPPDAKALFTHQVWSDLMRFGGNGTFSEVPYVNWIFTGDYHVWVDKKFVGADGQTIRVISPGACCSQSIDEPAEHYFAVWDGKTLTQVPLLSRPHLGCYTFETESDLANIDRLEQKLKEAEAWAGDALPENIRKPLVQVKVGEGVPGALLQVRKLLQDRAHLFAQSIITAVEENEAELPTAGATTLLEALPLMVPDRDSQLYHDMATVLTSPAPAEALNEIEKRWLGE